MIILEKKYRVFLMYVIFFLPIFSIFVTSNTEISHAEEYSISIPFGAYNPELNTPTDVWYSPPIINIKVGDTITWYNDDQEGHTVTSGDSAGRFGWMSEKQGKFGEPDGFFDSGRFMPNNSWTSTFEDIGTFSYFCKFHPWMEGIVIVEQTIPNYPHDATGGKIETFPAIQFTPDKLIEFDITWEPNIIKTFEKTKFIFQTYDAKLNSNLDKMKYDMIITQNGRILFQDSGITQVGGDYRNFIFETSGPIEIRFQNIVSGGTSGIESSARGSVDNPIFRTVVFTTIVYDNPKKTSTTEIIIQPAQRMDIYYEILVGAILIPALMLLGITMYMKFRKTKNYSQGFKSTPV
jgi:plastocyanin